MAVSSFKDVSWGANEQLATDKLNTMTANTRYLFERSPKMLFAAYGAKKDTGVKLMAGVVSIAVTQAPSRTIAVPFGSFFTVGCKPVIVTGVHGTWNGGLIATFYGMSGALHLPDHRGFNARISVRELNVKSNYVIKTSYLHWLAVGY